MKFQGGEVTHGEEMRIEGLCAMNDKRVFKGALGWSFWGTDGLRGLLKHNYCKTVLG